MNDVALVSQGQRPLRDEGFFYLHPPRRQNKGNTAQCTPDGSAGVSRQNFPCYFPKMLVKPPRLACAFGFISQKNFPACSTTWNCAVLPKKTK